jgi:prevent-host-death family protein
MLAAASARPPRVDRCASLRAHAELMLLSWTKQMAKMYNMHEAKTQLSKLAERAAQGEEIVIARNGRPLARLLALQERKPRKLGLWKNMVSMSEDFDDPLPWEIQRYFEGHSD